MTIRLWKLDKLWITNQTINEKITTRNKKKIDDKKKIHEQKSEREEDYNFVRRRHFIMKIDR
jgi:hypothetical protein